MKLIPYITNLCAWGGVSIALWAGPNDGTNTSQLMHDQTERATLGGGCFWCLDAVFAQLKGVKSVTSGYAGGHQSHPTYKEVCTGLTGHAEVVQVAFDPAQIRFAQLLEVFWEAHDPTTLNQQGPDVGTQYRSVIFYHNEDQRQVAEQSRAEAAKHCARPLVTEIQPFTVFYAAEGYHQHFYRDNANYPYCTRYIRPELEKLKERLQQKQ